jgi:hypothetical protein
MAFSSSNFHADHQPSIQQSVNEVTVTNNERELVVALEADIEIWESWFRYVERSIDLSEGKKSRHDDIPGLREWITFSSHPLSSEP